MKQNAGTPHCVNGKKGGSVLRQLIKGLFTLTLFLLTIFLFSGLIVYPLLAITLLQAYLTTFLTPISASPFFVPLLLVCLLLVTAVIIQQYQKTKWVLLLIGVAIAMVVLTQFTEQLLLLLLYLAILREKWLGQLVDFPLVFPLLLGGIGCLLLFSKSKNTHP